jgi:hypothetical protein
LLNFVTSKKVAKKKEKRKKKPASTISKETYYLKVSKDERFFYDMFGWNYFFNIF